MKARSILSTSRSRGHWGRSDLVTAALSFAFAFGALGCKGDSTGAAGAGNAEAIARGKAVYGSVCMACHNLNPKLDGALGPAVAGASRELLRLKVLENKYPAGYKPKRDTQQMVALPAVKADLESIAAFLESIK